MKYDYVIVGAGFFGATFARLATDAGKKCLVIDSRDHIAGNAYTKKVGDIDVHQYGPHIFHTNHDVIWNFVNRFAEFNNFTLRPKSFAKGKLYSLPFNMNTFNAMWGCVRPQDAKKIIEEQKFEGKPTNLEEQAISLVGRDVYELLIKGYTAKQWMKDPKDLPAFIIKRLPVRFTYDDNYFNDKYQGIPVDGYTAMFEKMLEGIDVRLNEDYFQKKEYYDSLAPKLVFTGKIDEFFGYEFGALEYRSLDFKHIELEIEDYQGVVMINYPDDDIKWTRIVEHKHFTGVKSDKTVITYEYPAEYTKDRVPYYPINDDKNQLIYNKYRERAESLENVIFGGRLAEYRYYDMHQVIGSAMKTVRDLNIINR
jgi:UDP-galactopyranose mutase